MSTGLYSHTTRAPGSILTAAIYNADHQNHITNDNPTMMGGYSDSLSQHQLNTDPGGLGAEVLAPNMATEIEQLRFQLKAITGKGQWYIPPLTNLETLGGSGVADGSITNAKLANMLAWKFKIRNAGTTGVPSDGGLGDITAEGSPALADSALGFKSTGEIRTFTFSALSTLFSGGGLSMPQGRLTLVTGSPSMMTTQSGIGTVRYTPWQGQFVPLYNGTSFSMIDTGGELSQAVTDATKSPAGVAANSNYDIFVWDDAGTKRATRGPAWTSGTARGSGAGTTELVRVKGIFLNANAITNGPAAQRGTYVGTIRTNGSSLVDWILGGAGAGGVAISLGVWNMYNRFDVGASCLDNTNSWTYEVFTWRPANNSTNRRASFIKGLAEDVFRVEAKSYANSGTTGSVFGHSIAYDVTNAPDAACLNGRGDLAQAASSGGVSPVVGVVITQSTSLLVKTGTDIGFHFFQEIEIGTPIASTGTNSFYGDNGETVMTSGMQFWGKM